MTELFPTVKVSEPSLRDVVKGLNLSCLVVRIQDLINYRSLKPNAAFYRIKNAGGIHNYLEHSGKVILSLVMRDDLIARFGVELYAEIINVLKADYYTSIDGETYEKEFEISETEIEKCANQTADLMKLCPNSKPIGQIKGCSKSQIEKHIQMFKKLGINDYIFHTGDFSRNGSPHMIARAKDYSLIIRKYANKLYLYGMGSQKRLLEFSFADAYITFNYAVKAFNGRILRGTKDYPSGGYNVNIVRHNLLEMIRNVKRIQYQGKLFEGGVCKWEEAVEEQEAHILAQEALIQAI